MCTVQPNSCPIGDNWTIQNEQLYRKISVKLAAQEYTHKMTSSQPAHIPVLIHAYKERNALPMETQLNQALTRESET